MRPFRRLCPWALLYKEKWMFSFTFNKVTNSWMNQLVFMSNNEQSFEHLVSNPNKDFVWTYLKLRWKLEFDIHQTEPMFYIGLITNRSEILYWTDLEPTELLYCVKLKKWCENFSLVILHEPKMRGFLQVAQLMNQMETNHNPQKELLTGLAQT